MRKAVLVLLAGILLVTVSACTTGATEPDEWGYVYSIGVDKGISDKLRFSFQFPTLSGQKKQGGGSESPDVKSGSDVSVITIDCPTLYAGASMIYSSYSRRLNFSHTKYLVISEELAKESVLPFINGMTRSAQIRRTMNVIICKGKAADFISEFKPRAGASFVKTQELLIENSERSALFDSETYNTFAVRIKCTKCQATATLAALNDFSHLPESGEQDKGFKSDGDYYPGEVPRRGLNKFELMGTAIFNGGTMVGELNGDETRAMQMLRGTYKESEIVIPDPTNPNQRISARVFPSKHPDVKITFDGGKVKIHAHVFLEGSLQNVQSTAKIETDEKNRTEEAFARFVKEKLDQTVQKCKELNCEVFDFAYIAAEQFWTIQDWEKFNWLSQFKDDEVTTEVSFIMRRTGTVIMTEEEKKT